MKLSGPYGLTITKPNDRAVSWVRDQRWKGGGGGENARYRVIPGTVKSHDNSYSQCIIITETCIKLTLYSGRY